MPKFSAASAVDSFDYDLRPWSDAVGVLPEPSSDQVAAFYAGLASAIADTLPAERVEGYDLSSGLDLLRLQSTLTREETALLYDHNLEIHADLCGGTPSRDDLAALPHRLQQAFYAAVQEWLRPEASRSATSS